MALLGAARGVIKNFLNYTKLQYSKTEENISYDEYNSYIQIHHTETFIISLTLR